MDRTIAEMQLRELTRSGERAIYFGALSDTRLDQYGPQRFAHLAQLRREAGLPEPTWVDVPLAIDGAVEALESIARVESVGFACYNDDVALAVVAAATRLGRRIPEDVAVVGVDHTPVGQLWTPPLTTIDVNVRAIMDASIRDLQREMGREVPDVAETIELARLIPGGTS